VCARLSILVNRSAEILFFFGAPDHSSGARRGIRFDDGVSASKNSATHNDAWGEPEPDARRESEDGRDDGDSSGRVSDGAVL
tara:strand:+ start:805 stop:1050 length:246 start_codon:yes stop_codon:yes gene_type:complete